MSTDASIRKVSVEVDASTLAMSPHGLVTGVVAIRAPSTSFPEARWIDFPVVVLSWWLEPLSRVLGGTSRVWECRFMDGPFSVRLEQQEGDTWVLRGLQSGSVEFTATVSCRAFIDALLEAAGQILRECRQRGWQGGDIETLHSAFATIQHDAA